MSTILEYVEEAQQEEFAHIWAGLVYALWSSGRQVTDFTSEDIGSMTMILWSNRRVRQLAQADGLDTLAELYYEIERRVNDKAFWWVFAETKPCQ